jgi:hypothetical protein
MVVFFDCADSASFTFFAEIGYINEPIRELNGFALDGLHRLVAAGTHHNSG